MMFHPEERVEILGARYKELIYDTDPFYAFDKFYDKVKGLHWLDRNLYVDGMTWLPDDILVKVDRATMASSIEARCPYLDPELVAYAASIPANLKMRFFNTKYILKKSLQDVLPQFILDKPKSGFNAPAGSWLGDDGLDEFKAFNKYVFERKIARCLN
jgi:asparagine synthase (glutamine-hydrolysing)